MNLFARTEIDVVPQEQQAFQPRLELGRFLRSRRVRMNPAAVGLPAASRQRSPGIRREELAVLANVSSAYYARLEQGSRARASAEVLKSLGDALRLDPVQQRYVHALNGPRPTPGSVGGDQHARVVERARQIVHEGRSDLPVYAVDAMGRLLGWNAPTARWYADFDARPGIERNLLWWTFTDPDAPHRIVDWPDHAHGMVAGLRYAMGVGRLDESADALVARLCQLSPDFAGWWDGHDVAEAELQHREFRLPDSETASVDLLTLRPALTDGISIVHHLPCRC